MYLPSSLVPPSDPFPTGARAYEQANNMQALDSLTATDALPSTYPHTALSSDFGHQEMAASDAPPFIDIVKALNATNAAVVQPRSMHITEPVIGEIVGAIALFVVVNVALVCLAYKRFCARRGTDSAEDAEHAAPDRSQAVGRPLTRARDKRNLPADGRIPLRRPKKHPPPVTAATDDRGKDGDVDDVELSPTSLKGAAVPALPAPPFRG